MFVFRDSIHEVKYCELLVYTFKAVDMLTRNKRNLAHECTCNEEKGYCKGLHGFKDYPSFIVVERELMKQTLYMAKRSRFIT